MQTQENRLRKRLDSNTQPYLAPLFQRFDVWQRRWDDLTEWLDEVDSQHTRAPGPYVRCP